MGFKNLGCDILSGITQEKVCSHAIKHIPSSLHHQILFQNKNVHLTRLDGQGIWFSHQSSTNIKDK
jgi:hypothetical protein